MADQPSSTGSGSWQPPHRDGDAANFPWVKPDHALRPEALAALQAQDAAPDGENGARELAQIGSTPAQEGAWYRPASDEAPPVPGEESEAIEEAVAAEALEAPILPDQLISARQESFAFQLPGDTGTFDPNRSGSLQGIGNQEAPAPPPAPAPQQSFDPSRSGQLKGLEAAPPFDSDKSGELEGIGAQPSAEENQRIFDTSRSGQLEGFAAPETAAVEMQTGIERAVPAALSPDDSRPVQQENPQTEGQEAMINQPNTPPRDQFKEVEDKVAILRRQFHEGRITREQLQDELRRLMILDDHGRWWMLGLETNRWYRYTGREWLPEEPERPQNPELVANAGQGYPQVQQALAVSPAPQEASGPVVLPRAGVPVHDPEATMVNQGAIYLEGTSFAAPTQQGMQAGDGSSQATVPAASTLDATLPAGSQDATLPGYPPAVAAQEQFAGVPAVQQPGFQGGSRREPNSIQPDYSEAFGGYLDRSSLSKWAVRGLIFGSLGILLGAVLLIAGMITFYFVVINDYRDEINNLGASASNFETTIIYDAQGNQLAQFNDPNTGGRKTVPLNEISPYLIHATVATEDESFYENPGFSIWGIFRATIRNVQTGGGGGGASTITQQLVRALLFDTELASERSAYRKIQEIFLASEISRKYSKNEILELYLNEIYYGNLAYGAEVAAETYFGKPASELNIAEAAFLAGLPQSPAIYDPVINPEVAKARMDDVLRLMVEANGDGCIQMQHEGYNTQPFCVTQEQLDIEFIVQIAEVKVRTFSRPQFEATYPHFVNYVMSELEERYGQSVYGAGFQVYTTLRPDVQEVAQQALLEQLPAVPQAHNGSIVAMRPQDGAVLAMVGSADFNSDGLSDVDGRNIDGLVNIAFSPQQPGSSIKPFVYLGAFEGVEGQYLYPGSILWDVPTCYPGPPDYCPRNFSGTFAGPVPVRIALGNSLNIPAIKALAFTNFGKYEEVLQRFGIRTPLQSPSQAGLPSAIGAAEVRLFDMVRAYGALANNGVMHEPYAVLRVVNPAGEEIYSAPENPEGVQVVDPQHAYLVTNVLADANSRFQGAQWLSIPGWNAAAKTGSTNGPTDVWTIGYTPAAVAGVWIGNTDNSPMGFNVSGSFEAAPIWNKTMQAALAGLSPVDFPVPEGIAQFQVCDYTGAIYTEETCPGGFARNEIAIAGKAPPASNNSFITTREVDSFSGLLANEHCNEYVEVRSFINLSDPTAAEWLNGAGQAWAQQHGIDLPISTPPTESCQPGQPRPQVVINVPAANSEVSGLVEVRGQVDLPGFASYAFYVANQNDPENFIGPLEVRNSPQPNPNSLLGAPDLTSLPDGNYILRLQAQNDRGVTVETDVPIVVRNAAIPQPTLAPTLTPVPQVELTPTPTENLIPTQDTGTGGEAPPVTGGQDTDGDGIIDPVAPAGDGSGQ